MHGWCSCPLTARPAGPLLFDVLRSKLGMSQPPDLPPAAELERERREVARRDAADAEAFAAWNLDRTTAVPTIWTGRAPVDAIDELITTLENGGRIPDARHDRPDAEPGTASWLPPRTLGAWPITAIAPERSTPPWPDSASDEVTGDPSGRGSLTPPRPRYRDLLLGGSPAHRGIVAAALTEHPFGQQGRRGVPE